MTGSWHGNIQAQQAIVAGKIVGGLIVEDKLEIGYTAVIRGRVSARTVAIAKGAIVDGEIEVTSGEPVIAVRGKARGQMNQLPTELFATVANGDRHFNVVCSRVIPHPKHQRSQMKEYDVVIVGGGIHGAGVLQAAAAAGHSALLIERQALAAGTSSRSSKLIHGGLRYLESGQFALVRESLRERAIHLRIAAELVALKPFLFRCTATPDAGPGS